MGTHLLKSSDVANWLTGNRTSDGGDSSSGRGGDSSNGGDSDADKEVGDMVIADQAMLMDLFQAESGAGSGEDQHQDMEAGERGESLSAKAMSVEPETTQVKDFCCTCTQGFQALDKVCCHAAGCECKERAAMHLMCWTRACACQHPGNLHWPCPTCRKPAIASARHPAPVCLSQHGLRLGSGSILWTEEQTEETTHEQLKPMARGCMLDGLDVAARCLLWGTSPPSSDADHEEGGIQEDSLAMNARQSQQRESTAARDARPAAEQPSAATRAAGKTAEKSRIATRVAGKTQAVARPWPEAKGCHRTLRRGR
jgi:hypothetical protein